MHAVRKTSHRQDPESVNDDAELPWLTAEKRAIGDLFACTEVS